MPVLEAQVHRLEHLGRFRDVATLDGELVVIGTVDRAEEDRAMLKASLHDLHVAELLRQTVRLQRVDRHDVRHGVRHVVEEPQRFSAPRAADLLAAQLEDRYRDRDGQRDMLELSRVVSIHGTIVLSVTRAACPRPCPERRDG